MPKNSASEVRQYDLRPLPGSWFYTEKSAKYINGVLAWLLVAAFLTMVALQSGASASSGPDDAFFRYGKDLTAFMAACLVLMALESLVWDRLVRPWLYRRALVRFQMVNGLDPADPDELLRHIPTSVKNPFAYDQSAEGYVFQSGQGRALVFDYDYAVGTGRDKKEFHYGIAVLTFDKKFPHLYLDAKANGKGPKPYSESQRVQLEGDFSRYFTLYMPEGSAAGSLAVLTPDVMQTLIRYGRPVDVEIQGHDVAAITEDPAFMKQSASALLSCISALYSEIAHLEVSWRPVMDHRGKDYNLRVGTQWKPLIRLAIMLALYFVLYHVLPHTARR